MNFDILFGKLQEKYNNGELIGDEFIGNLSNDQFESELIEYTSKELYKELKYVAGCDKPIYILGLLSFIAMKYYDGDFWGHTCEVLCNYMYGLSDQTFCSKLRSFIKKNNASVSLGRTIDFPVIQSIVPVKFIDSYFTFCFDIYFYNFRCSLKGFEKNDLRSLFEALKTKMDTKDNSLDVKGLNKTYVLIQATKNIIIKNYGLKSLIKLTEKIIRIIDNYYWDKPQEELPPYFLNPFNAWKKTISNEEKERVVREAKNRTEYVKWTPKYILENSILYLETREDNVSDIYDRKDIYMEIYEDNILVEKRINLRISAEIMGGYRIKPERFKIDNPFAKIRYCLKCNESIIYDSDTKLNRENFIIFNDKGNEIKNNTDHKNEVIGYVIPKEYSINGVTKYFENDNYKVCYKRVDENTLDIVGDSVIRFTSMPDEGITGELVHNAYINYNPNKHIYRKVNNIVFIFNADPSNVAINVNDKRYRINEYENAEIIKKNDCYIALINCSKFTVGYYNISFNLLGTKKDYPQKYEFVIDEDFNYHTEHIENNIYKFIFESSAFEMTEFEFELDEKWERSFKADYDDYEVGITLLFDKPIYRYNKKWHLFDDYIWFADVFGIETLQIIGLQVDKIQVLDYEDNILIDSLGYKKIIGLYNIDIGSFSSYSSFPFVSLNVIDNNGNNHKLKIAYKVYFEDLDIKYDKDEKKLVVCPMYLGKDQVNVEISSNKEVLFDQPTNSNTPVIFEYVEPFVSYIIRIKYMDFSSFTEVELKKEKFVDADIENISGCYFVIKSCLYYIYEKNRFKKNETFVKNIYKKIISTSLIVNEKIGDHRFKISLSRKVNDSIYRYKNLNDLEIEFTSNIDNYGNCTAVITSEEDLVLYDNNKLTIFDGDHPKLYPIEDFELKFGGKIK